MIGIVRLFYATKKGFVRTPFCKPARKILKPTQFPGMKNCATDNKTVLISRGCHFFCEKFQKTEKRTQPNDYQQ